MRDYYIVQSQSNLQFGQLKQIKIFRKMPTFGNDFKSEVQFVSEIRSLDYLIRDYPNEILIPQFKKLQQSYPYYRAVRGDGNCFYRAIAFLYLREANFQHFSNVFQTIQNSCIGHSLQFEGITFQHKLRQLYQYYLAPLRNTSPMDRQNKLADCFNQSLVFDTIMMMYFRSLNYQYIKLHQDMFIQYITSQETIEKVRYFGNDSEGIQYVSMAKSLKIQIECKITIQHHLKSQTYNKDPSIQSYDLFFRPGHFDILYHKDSPYINKKYSQYPNHVSPLKQSKTQSYFQRVYEQKSPKSSFIPQKNNLMQNSPQSSKKNMKDQKFPFSNLNPLVSLNNLRQKTHNYISKDQFSSTKDLKNKSKLKEADIFQSKTQIPTQKYKAWQNQTSLQSQPLRKIKQIFVIVLFLSGLGYIFYAI